MKKISTSTDQKNNIHKKNPVIKPGFFIRADLISYLGCRTTKAGKISCVLNSEIGIVS